MGKLIVDSPIHSIGGSDVLSCRLDHSRYLKKYLKFLCPHKVNHKVVKDKIVNTKFCEQNLVSVATDSRLQSTFINFVTKE